MKVCIIGAGVSGLCTLKRAIESQCEAVAFEQSAEIGGTWVLREEVGRDKHGLSVHSSMYKGLRTDIPKEVMCYPDRPYPTTVAASYISSSDVLDYLSAYARHFGLLEKIKFEHSVVRVRPLSEGWEVIVRKLPNESFTILTFDAVFVCTGNFHTPHRPIYKGSERFRGVQLHSHDYRDAERFRDEIVCIIGSGPSGIDLVQAIAATAARVFWSTHQQQLNITLGENVTRKPDIVELSADGAAFADGTSEKFSTVLYCTGYRHSFPFLSVDCGIVVEENFVSPLYKHCLNINRPTMAFIGLPTVVCNNQAFDFQARFCLKFMTGRVELPSKEAMLRDHERTMSEQWKRGLTKTRAHLLGFEFQEKYFEELATIAQLSEPVKPVILKIFNRSIQNLFSSLNSFRERNFKVLSDEAFEEEEAM